jgi:cytochrome c-type biogenesis protein CcmF
VNGYTVRYVRPTASATPQRLAFGAVLDVSQGGKHVTTLHTSRGFYPSQDPSLGPIGRFFNGEADSDVGLQWGATRNFWTVINPDLSPLNRLISRGNALFGAALPKAMLRASRLPPAQAQASLAPLWQLRDQAISGIATRFVSHPWPVSFLLIVDPLVSWIWIGAIIIALGGLLALWPVPRLARRRGVERVPVPAGAVPGAPAPSTPATVTAARELV